MSLIIIWLIKNFPQLVHKFYIIRADVVLNWSRDTVKKTNICVFQTLQKFSIIINMKNIELSHFVDLLKVTLLSQYYNQQGATVIYKCIFLTLLDCHLYYIRLYSARKNVWNTYQNPLWAYSIYLKPQFSPPSCPHW